jgi:probable H4MPT-linked C1 transfer pathway protein
MPGNALGLDIGGANLKAATADGGAVSRPFELWKYPERLADELAKLASDFPGHGPVAVTMTGELCDCFETKRDGVEHILAAAAAVFGEQIRVWSTGGRFLKVVDARRSPLSVAAANWHALATFVGRLGPRGPALLVDVGSTTTDVIPILNGIPVSRGRTDSERMRFRELVYTGVRRTPVCSLLGPTVAAEVFATMLDVYLRLGVIPENAADRDTADGRPATIRHALGRLARMLGGDAETCTESDTLALAQNTFDAQKSLITAAVRQVRERLSPEPDQVIISGSGEFLARAALESAFENEARPKLISFRQRFGDGISTAACAYATASLAAEGRE